MTASTLSSWARLVWEELNKRQLDANQIFRQVGLDPSKLSQNTARFPVENMLNLWQQAVQVTGDECFGIDTGNRWNPTTFHALGFAWLASSSLGEALQRLARYGRFLNDAIDYELESAALDYFLRLRTRADLANDPNFQRYTAGADAAIVALLKMLRMLLGEAFSPKQIVCNHHPDSASLMLEQIARCPIHYGSDHIEFVFDRHDVERKLPSGNVELSQAHEQIILKHLAEMDQDDLVAKVRFSVFEKLPSGDVRDSDIAQELNMSTRTMQRRLAEEGTSFSVILKQIREDLASQYIKDDKLAISEVAYLLGFSDQSNFTRAFKRWYGVSPTQFRNQETLAH